MLLAKRAAGRSSYPGVWDLPGGHCEQGETAKETLARELREEIGVTPTEAADVAAFHIPDTVDGGIELRIYVVTAWEGEPRNVQQEEHDEVGWFTIDEACRLPLASPEYPSLFRRVMSTAR